MQNFKRFFDVGTTLTGMGMRLGAQQYLGLNIDDANYAQKLRLAFGGLKGPFMKIVQFLATIPDALPPEYAEEFLNLQSQAPSMGINFVKRRMVGELGSDWRNFFTSFDENASYAASLGQVHKAVTPQGETLALKLQYPDMQRILEADFKQLETILSLYKAFNKSLQTDAIFTEIKERLLEELDYENEACNIEIFQAIFQEYDFVTVPKVYKNLSTKRLLAMEWIEGKKILDYESNPQNICNDLGKKLFLSWYMPLYRHGILHADPHPGNYLVTKNHQIALLDFGCVRKFDKRFLQAVVDLYKALRDDLPELAVDAYRRWGFENLTNELINILNTWASLLYEPLLDNKIRPVQSEDGGKKGFETARLVHRKLHELGGVRPPQEFVFMDRAAVGIGAVLMRLKSEQNWHQLFEEIANSYF